MADVVPPDNRTAGQAGHLSDHTNIADVLTAVTTGTGPIAGVTVTNTPSGANQVLTSTGTTAADWQAGGGGGGGGISPPAGDIGGTALAPTVAKIQGTTVSAPSGGAASFLNATGGWTIPPGVMWFNVVSNYGADPTGAADSHSAIQSAISAAITAGGGVVYLPKGTYKVNTTLTASVANTPVYIVGDGLWATTLMFYGTGDCLRVVDTTLYTSRTGGGGGVLGLTIDGTNHTSTAAAGLHMGDIVYYKLDVGVQNFYATSDIGVHLDNANYWTEQLHGDVYATNCTSHVVFDVASAGTTGTGSFARLNLNCTIDQIGPSFNGVVLQNGAFIYDGALAIRGNFSAQSGALTGNPAVLTITGSAPGGHPASNSNIASSRLDIQAECGAGTHTPQTIYFGTSGTNFIRGCYGVMDFAGGGVTFSQSNIAAVPGALWYSGPISGDLALCPVNIPAGSGALPTVSGSLLYSEAYAAPAGSIYSYSGDFFAFTLTSPGATIALGADLGHSPGTPQRLTIVITQAAAASYGVTWPSATYAAATTTAPGVYWPGNTAPVMTATYGATDCYLLETADGAHWYGRAIQPGPTTIAQGGTGQVTATAARAALNEPMLGTCQAVATVNITLSGTQTIDGYAASAGDLILAAGQTTASQNGPWTVASGSWTRPGDFASAAVVRGRAVQVSGGTVYANSAWSLSSTASVTVDTTSQTWVLAAAAPNVQWFNSTPTTYTWTKPAGAKTVYVFAVGGGGQGGSGAAGTSAAARTGGGGGAGGTVMFGTFAASDLSGTVTVTVGGGGSTGGAAVTGTTVGNNGQNGGNSQFGAYLLTPGGPGGKGGGAGAAGAGGTGQGGIATGGSGAASSSSGGAGVGVNPSVGPGGGAAGGGIVITTQAASAGATTSYSYLGSASNSGGAGSIDSTLPTGGAAITVQGTVGCGAGSGASSITTNAQAGANAAGYGGGGGGGGAAMASFNSGAGGTGYQGYVLVISYFQ